MAKINSEKIGSYLLDPFPVNAAIADEYRYPYDEVVAKIREMSTTKAVLAIREMVCNDLFFLMYYVMGRKDINQYNKPFILRAIHEVESGPRTDTVDLWARGHYKSSIITQALTVQEHCNNPDAKIGIFSHTRPIAKGFLLPIKTAYESSQILIHCFNDIFWENPRKEAPVWSMDDGLSLKSESRGNTQSIEAWGLVDGMPTSKHYDLRIYDDVVTDKTVGTPEMIAKVRDAIRLSDNLGVSDGTGRQRIVGTIYNYGDYYSDCRKDADMGVYPWHIRTKPWFDRDKTGVKSPPITELSDERIDDISVLLPAKTVREKHKKQGPYIFACQMELDPSNEEMREFKRSDIKYYTKLPDLRNKYIFVDPANEKKKQSDYTVIALISICAQGNRYVEALIRDRLNLGERWEKLKGLVRKHPDINGVWYEKYGKDSDIWYMEQQQQKDGLYFQIDAIGGTTSKIDRIRRLIPIVTSKRFFIPVEPMIYNGVDLIETMIAEEIDTFPYCVHDDILDAVSRVEDPAVCAAAPVVTDDIYGDYAVAREQYIRQIDDGF